MTILTDEQIETAITQAHADVLFYATGNASQRETDRGIVGALRVVYTMGRDQGTAETLEKARTMLVAQVADERTVQLGRSVAAILAWCDAVPGRFMGGVGANHAHVMRSESEPKSDDGFYSHYAHGSDANEALSELATWCTENAARAVVADPFPTSDTISAPPPFEPVAADKCYLESGE